MRVRSLATLLTLAMVSCETPSQSGDTESSYAASGDVADGADDTSSQARGATAPTAQPSESKRSAPLAFDAGAQRSLVDASASTKSLEGGDATLAQANTGMPCDVLEIVSTHCLRCHGEMPVTAISLTTREHFVAPLPNDPNGKIYERAKQRIHDADDPMPPRSTQDKLTERELATLDAWFEAGAPRAAGDCQTNTADAGAAPVDPVIDRSLCEFEVDLRANNGVERSDDSAFPIAKGEELYECFNFDIPWADTAHALTFEPLIDNRSVLHHWSLFAIEEKLPSGKRPGKCDTGTRAGLAAWAPGDRPTVLPDDVGVRISGGKVATFQLEIHYNNLTGASEQKDRSGVHVCATSKKRPHEAVPVIFGPLCFGSFCEGLPPGRSEVSNTCMNLSDKGPAHVLWSSPHMHRLGRHMKTVINRADGGVETLVDIDFDFDDQRDYPSDKIIYAGDSLTTTCTFENDSKSYVEWGESTTNEMCFNFLMVYPPESISSIEGFCTGLF